RTGALVMNDTPTRVYACAVDGTDASSAGPTGTDSSVTVGGLTWSYVGPGDAPPNADTLAQEQLVRNAASPFLLLDFADLLQQLLPSVWNATLSGTPPPSSDLGSALYAELASKSADTRGSVTWSAALLAAWQAKETWQAKDVFT